MGTGTPRFFLRLVFIWGEWAAGDHEIELVTGGLQNVDGYR